MPWARRLSQAGPELSAALRASKSNDAPSGIDADSTPTTIAHLVVQRDATQLDAARSSISANAEISDVRKAIYLRKFRR